MRLLNLLFSVLQNVLLLLMAPLTLAVCAGLILCTLLVTWQMRAPKLTPRWRPV